MSFGEISQLSVKLRKYKEQKERKSIIVPKILVTGL